MTAAQAEAAIASIHAAMAKGVKSLKLNGEEVQFDSFDEMRKRIAYFRELATAAPQGMARVSYPTTSRGL